MKQIWAYISWAVVALLASQAVFSQSWKSDSAWKHSHKNIVRYNLSNALLFGFDRAIIFGYERVLSPRRSVSINIGQAGLPKFLKVETDSFTLGNERKSSGIHLSADYRFYLAKENKYPAPRGVYIGPYYSFNRWKRENSWDFTGANADQKLVSTETDFKLNSLGFELGYQFVFWNRLSVDMVLIGPGIGWYNIKAQADGNLSDAEREQITDALQDLLTQKFPGMNFVLADKQFDANGTISTTSVGFRYLLQVGFRF